MRCRPSSPNVHHRYYHSHPNPIVCITYENAMCLAITRITCTPFLWNEPELNNILQICASVATLEDSSLSGIVIGDTTSTWKSSFLLSYMYYKNTQA